MAFEYMKHEILFIIDGGTELERAPVSLPMVL